MDLVDKRFQLILEEYEEASTELETYRHYLKHPDYYDTTEISTVREALAKELADLLYVVYGTAEELDIPLEEVFREVHDNNMTKVWPDGQVHYNEYGKVIKPPGFTHLDLSGVLNEFQL